jgi:hypothetical protein
MWNSEKYRALPFVGVFFAMSMCSSLAEAQQQAQGFAVERLYLSAPGGGWFVMDSLDMQGGLGGGVALTTGYAHDSLRVRSNDGSQPLAVVSGAVFADVGLAVTYERFRLYANFTSPLLNTGNSGTAGAYDFTAPNFTPGTQPDTISDPRIGFDARFLGDAESSFRLGAGVQLIFPSGNRADYDTDGTYRAMGRVLVAGDVENYTYAGQLGVHIRRLDDSPTPESPEGSELIFGIAGGAKIPVPGKANWVFITGPEVFGASAFRYFMTSHATALEGLLSGRLESMGSEGQRISAKLGMGVGLNAQFGSPEWRLVLGFEFLNHSDKKL